MTELAGKVACLVKVHMSGKQKHRGAHPEDSRLFGDAMYPLLLEAVGDLAWLLSRGYADASSLKLVGDRYKLTERQRKVLMRATCSAEAERKRLRGCLSLAEIAGKDVWIDGFNVLISVESALSGGFLFRGQDSVLRDNSSVHGSYRRVEETVEAIERIGKALEMGKPASVKWLLDQPVSNSGRLLTMLYEIASQNNWIWQVELVPSPDALLKHIPQVVATSDGIILENASSWIDLPSAVCDAFIPDAKILDFSGTSQTKSPVGS